MKIILSHPTGNANVRAIAKGISDIDALFFFYTSLACFPNNFWDVLSRLKPFSELQRRTFDPNLRSITKMHPFKELGRILSLKLKLNSLIKAESGYFSIDQVYRYNDTKLAQALGKCAELSGVYAYEDGALESFKMAKQLGFSCFYDLPIGYWRSARKLLKEEKENRTDWACTLTGFYDSPKKLDEKDAELSMANRIFVASNFTAKTLADYPGQLAPISIIPYGFPPAYKQRDYQNLRNRPLKLLFVGGLSQRKGIANVIEAVDKIGNAVTLTIVGHKITNNCKPLNDGLSRHNWIPSLPHSDILKLMRQYDVLLFPSLFEGFGLVITEAMSQGTPVITTDRTAGGDLIQNEENGWLVKAGSTDALIHTIESILNKPDRLAEIGRAAVITAANRTWDDYGKEVAKNLSSINL